MLGKGGVLSEMVARVIAGHLSSYTQRGTWMTRTSRVWYRAGRYPQKTEGRIFPDTHTHKDPTRLAPSNLGGKEMAYFHVFSLSLFIFSFLSVSSSSCVNGQWNGFFRTASRLLHSIFETLMCLWHIFCLSHVKTFFVVVLQEFWSGRRAAISSPESEVGLPSSKHPRLDDFNPPSINHTAGQVRLSSQCFWRCQLVR